MIFVFYAYALGLSVITWLSLNSFYKYTRIKKKINSLRRDEEDS